MRRWTIVAVAVSASLLLAGPPAYADPVEVTLGSAEVELMPADAGGGTASVALTNLTDAPIDLEARPRTPQGDCAVTLDQDGRLQPARTTTLKATLTTACGQVDDSFTFVVTTPGDDLLVTAKVEENEKPYWGALDWFVWATVAALVLMAAVCIAFCSNRDVKLQTALPHLEDSWSFKDSWVSNVTVVGGLLAGIFGSSEVVKAMLGEDADEAVALATIGGAISIAMIGAAGVLVIALKTLKDGKLTVVGVLAGSTLALGGAGGQLLVVYESARDLDLGGIEDNLDPYLVGSLALLVGYGFFSVLGVLIQGHTKPDDVDPAAEPVTETVFSAAVLAAALPGDRTVTRAEVNKLLETLQPLSETEAGAREGVPRATRAASFAGGPVPKRGSGRAAMP